MIYNFPDITHRELQDNPDDHATENGYTQPTE